MKVIRNQTKSLGKSKRTYVWCTDESMVWNLKVRKRVRCPTCNRRLLPREQYCVGGEFIGFKIPPHKYAIKEGRA